MIKSKKQRSLIIFDLLARQTTIRFPYLQTEFMRDILLEKRDELIKNSLLDSNLEQIIDDFIALLQRTNLVYSQLEDEYANQFGLLKNELTKDK